MTVTESRCLKTPQYVRACIFLVDFLAGAWQLRTFVSALENLLLAINRVVIDDVLLSIFYSVMLSNMSH